MRACRGVTAAPGRARQVAPACGAVDAAGACCASGLADASGACCRPGAVLDGDARCCASGRARGFSWEKKSSEMTAAGRMLLQAWALRRGEQHRRPQLGFAAPVVSELRPPRRAILRTRGLQSKDLLNATCWVRRSWISISHPAQLRVGHAAHRARARRRVDACGVCGGLARLADAEGACCESGAVDAQGLCCQARARGAPRRLPCVTCCTAGARPSGVGVRHRLQARRRHSAARQCPGLFPLVHGWLAEARPRPAPAPPCPAIAGSARAGAAQAAQAPAGNAQCYDVSLEAGCMTRARGRRRATWTSAACAAGWATAARSRSASPWTSSPTAPAPRRTRACRSGPAAAQSG